MLFNIIVDENQYLVSSSCTYVNINTTRYCTKKGLSSQKWSSMYFQFFFHYLSPLKSERRLNHVPTVMYHPLRVSRVTGQLLPTWNCHVAPLPEPIHDPNKHAATLRNSGSPSSWCGITITCQEDLCRRSNFPNLVAPLRVSRVADVGGSQSQWAQEFFIAPEPQW